MFGSDIGKDKSLGKGTFSCMAPLESTARVFASLAAELEKPLSSYPSLSVAITAIAMGGFSISYGAMLTNGVSTLVQPFYTEAIQFHSLAILPHLVSISKKGDVISVSDSQFFSRVSSLLCIH